jgi:outer membrane biosynthesis protein TonB
VTQLIVTLTPGSTKPAKIELVQSTGDMILNAAAIEVARESEFTPETHACTPVGGRYFYNFEF